MLNFNLGPFSIQATYVLGIMSMLIAAAVGQWAGRRQKTGISIGIGNVLIDMLWLGLLSARLVFVALWFDQYRQAPWSILDLRDGGFAPWAGLSAALSVALWRGWRQQELRKPLGCGLLAGALAWDMSGASSMAGISRQAALPAVSLQTLTGATTRLSAIAKGKPMMVNLWASWCPPCRREMPVLAAAQQQETMVQFVFANQGEDVSVAQRYLSSGKLNLLNVVLDAGAELGRTIGSTALPTTLFYDASGKLVDIHLGALSAASLADKLDQLRPRTTPSSTD